MRTRTLFFVALLAVALCAGADPDSASATTWLCPSCLQSVEREAGAELDCSGCGGHFTSDELSWVTSYANYRTRDVELNWLLLPEDCGIFSAEGLQAFAQPRQEVWVPWTAVHWFLPRMRIVKLTDGRELATDYAKTPEHCPHPPKFVFDFADSIRIEGQPPRALRLEVEPSLAEIFFVAESPKARQEARARFILEVEEGKHPRLPRTDARVHRQAMVTIPSSVARPDLSAKAELEVRANDQGNIIRLRVVKSSGMKDLDRALLAAAQSNGYFPAGEMGVPVPATMRLHYAVVGNTTTLEAKPAVPMIWEP